MINIKTEYWYNVIYNRNEERICDCFDISTSLVAIKMRPWGHLWHEINGHDIVKVINLFSAAFGMNILLCGN